MKALSTALLLLFLSILLPGCGNFEWLPDSNPVIISTASLPNGTVGDSSYTLTMAATGGAGSYTWVWSGGIPPGLTMSSAGIITGTPTSAGTFTVSITAKDTSTSNPRTASKSYTITILPAGALTIATTSPLLPAIVLGQYTTSFRATGGISPYNNWSTSKTATCPPPGLTLSKSGKWSGAPTTAASACSFDVSVWDSANVQATKNFSITVLPTLTITTTGLADGKINTLYVASATLTSTQMTATGGSGTYTWSWTGAPNGLTLSTKGLIDGIPTAANTFSTTITATDASWPQFSDIRTYSITITP